MKEKNHSHHETILAKPSESCSCHSHDEEFLEHCHCDDTEESGSIVPSCGCGHEHGEEENPRPAILKLLIAAIFLAAGYFLGDSRIAIVAFIASYLVAGYSHLITAIKNLVALRPFDETLLMTVATIGAVAMGEWSEACLVMILFGMGELLEDFAVARSQKSISALLDLKPDFANLLRDGEIVSVAPGEVAIGDSFVVRPFERVPLDGIVVDGESTLDNSMLTGESIPVSVSAGSEVLSGCINNSGALTLKATKAYADSTVSKIIKLTEQAAKNKAKSERFITKFSRVYTPIVVGLAVLVAVLPPVIIGLSTGDYSFLRWIRAALTFLIISCPCALVISVPLTFVSGIGSCSRRGILVKGADSLERLVKTDCVAFDKTGTLTRGRFEIQEIVPQNGYTADQLLEAAAHAAYLSTHPVSRAAVDGYPGTVRQNLIEDAEEIAGKGVRATIQNNTVLFGNRSFLFDHGISVTSDVPENQTVSYIAIGNTYAGFISVGDSLRPDAKETINSLKSRGIHTVMLTGDNPKTAASVAELVGVDEFQASLLPKDKLDAVIALKNKYHEVVFLGDGINDAPVITAADTGISMGGLGSDAAIEASDVVLMTDEPKRLVTAIDIAKKTRSIVIQNVALSLGIKTVVMFLGLLGQIPLWLAVIADVGAMLIAVMNALRALRISR